MALLINGGRKLVAFQSASCPSLHYRESGQNFPWPKMSPYESSSAGKAEKIRV